MSVTGHRDVRHPDDFYATPEWCTRLLLPFLQRGSVYEPSCGAGAIGKVVFEAWNKLGNYDIIGCEIDEGRADQAVEGGYFDQVQCHDFLNPPPDLIPIGEGEPWPLVVMNPPFSLALQFVQKSLKMADTVAALLRLNWLASAERNDFHRNNPSDLIILPRRPSFAKFVSCAGNQGSPRTHSLTTAPCGWKATIAPNEQHLRECPLCGAKTKMSATDSADYGWFIWGPGRGGRIIHPPIDVRRVDAQFETESGKLEGLLT